MIKNKEMRKATQRTVLITDKTKYKRTEGVFCHTLLFHLLYLIMLLNYQVWGIFGVFN